MTRWSWRAPFGLGLIAAVMTGTATAQPPPHPMTKAAAALLGELESRNLFQGAVVLARGDTVIYEGAVGFADRERQLRFSPDSRMDAASVAKTVTAAAVLTLVEQGRLDFDAEVRMLVPAFPYPGIRVRHLLTHSAGLPQYEWLDARVVPGTVRTNESHLALIARQRPRPDFPAGTAFRYDNVAYDVAAMVVAQVTGRNWSDFVVERFLAPIGVGAFLRPVRLADWPTPRVRGYRFTGGGWEPFDGFDLEGFHGAANLVFSARDLQRWAARYARAVGPAVLARAGRPGALDDGRSTGISLGSFYQTSDSGLRYYTGHHQGFFSISLFDARSGLSLGLTANNAPPTWIQTGLPRALLALADGLVPETLAGPPPSDSTAEPGGTYRIPELGSLEVKVGPNRSLRVRFADVWYDAFPVEPNVHFVPGLDAALRFRARPGGGVALSWDSIAAGRREGSRITPERRTRSRGRIP